MKKRVKKTNRHGGRVVLSLDVEPSAREALRQKAAQSGVSMAEYFTNAIAEPEKRTFCTAAAEIGGPLVRVSYLQIQARAALTRGDIPAALSALDAAQRCIADALIPLARRHDVEVRENERAIAFVRDYRGVERMTRPPHEKPGPL